MPTNNKYELWQEAKSRAQEAVLTLGQAALRCLAAAMPTYAALALEESDQHYDGRMVVVAAFTFNGDRVPLSDPTVDDLPAASLISLDAAMDLSDANQKVWRKLTALDMTPRMVTHPSGELPAEFLLDLRKVRTEVGA